MLKLCLALLLSIRCQHEEATLQLLRKFYHSLPEQQSKSILNKLIYILQPQERDWLKNLA